MISLNAQPAEKPAAPREDGALEVVGVWKTLQGEGPFAGRPAVFVRLAGCNLTCGGCDTDYTSRRRFAPPWDLLTEVYAAWGSERPRLVVLTGGEPFRQDVRSFALALVNGACDVQVETNGTLYPPADLPWGAERLTVVCSPKAAKVNPRLAPHVTVYKYVLDADHVDPGDGLPTACLGEPLHVARPHAAHVPVYVQPLDVQDEAENRRHRGAAVASCLKHGYTLSLQVHKLLGLE